LVVFIAVSVAAMFTTSRLPGKMKWIGMKVVPLNAEARAARGIPASVGGVLVENVDGMAGRAGVRSGDVVVGINGNRVVDVFDFLHFSGETDISKRGVQIDLVRNGSRLPVFVFPPNTATQAPGQTTPPAGVAAAPVTMAQAWLGIEGETVGAGDLKELGLPAGAQGVVVDTVTPGGRAEQAGLLNNDVIVAVNGQRIDSSARLWDSLARLNGTDAVDLGVYRGGQLVSVPVPAAAAAPAGGFGGRMGGLGLGPGGILTCPKCATTVVHQRGVPCYTVACPACGTTMVRTQ
jgi:S1-C subfamily serine protease